MALADVINLTISRSAPAVSRQGFGVALILGPNAPGGWGSDIVRNYSSAAAMLLDGFTTSNDEYKAALALMAQDNQPTTFAVGKRATTVAQVETITPTAVDLAVYTVTINGTAYTFTAGSGTSATLIVTGLKAAIGSPTNVTASGTTTLILTSSKAGVSFSLAVGTNLAVAHTTANVGPVEDLTGIFAVDNTPYAVIMTSRDNDEILEVAAYVETLRKIFVTSTGDAAVIAAGSSDIASKLKAKSYARTAYLYSGNAAAFPEAAWLGGQLPLQPGSSTYKFKTLHGITVDNLTPTQYSVAKAKNAGVYTLIGGLGATEEGVVASGEFIDIIVGIDWLYANMTADVFQQLMDNPKVPYTDVGAGVIQVAVQTRLTLAVKAGILSGSPAPTVTVPSVSSQAPSDRAARRLAGITFQGTLAGAIHLLTITGSVTV